VPSARASLAGPAAAAVVAVAVLGVAWTRLYEGVGAWHIVLLCAVAALPAAATAVPRVRSLAPAAATLAAIIIVFALSLRVSAWDLLTWDTQAWEGVRGILPDGLAQGSSASLPITPSEHPAFAALLDVALAALAGVAVWQIVVRRRPVGALLAVGVGLAYCWTVEPPASPALAGGLALAGFVAVLALAGWRGALEPRVVWRLGGAVTLGAVAVLVAAGIGGGPAKAGEPWWGWQDWSLGSSSAASGRGLDLRQAYGKLDWPATPRVALTVQSDTARPLRAVSLDDFDGVAFTLAETGASDPLVIQDGTITADVGDRTEGEDIEQRVTLRSASSQVVLASGRAERVTGPFAGTADMVGDAIRVNTPITGGDSYTVQARIPQASPAELTAARPYDPADAPAGSTRLRATFWGDPVEVPLWGSGLTVEPAALGAYAPVHDLAVRVAGDAATPYAAVNRIEAYLRRNYVYDEQPPYPTSLPDDWPADMPRGRPPLVDFLFGSRRGYCQHFAGSMAVMLRSLGIPSRVAVGYTGGRFDAQSDRWVVTDRDAHAWVEVWFPGHGWLPFDPTPGRSAPNPSSVSSPDYAPSRSDVDLGGLADTPVEPVATPTPESPAPDPAPSPEAPSPTADAAAGGGGAPWWLGLAGLAGACALVAPAGRAVRRARGRHAGDERSRVVAAARELEASLAPLGFAPSAAASASERAQDIRERTGVDPSALYARASRARFASDPPPAGEAAAAWRESSRLRRAIRRRAPLGRRVLTALGLRRPRRGTVDR
jgi:transglutaminase-like putative cysteine protease